MQKVPYMLVIGDREVDNGTVAFRSRKDGDQGPRAVDALIEALAEEVRLKRAPVTG